MEVNPEEKNKLKMRKVSSWKKGKKQLCFATNLAMWNSSHHPSLGLKLLSLKVPSHWALVSATEILKLMCKIVFKFCVIWVGAHWSPTGSERPLWSVGWQCADLLVSFPTQCPLFDEVSVRAVISASYSLIGLKCILFGVVFWGAD